MQPNGYADTYELRLALARSEADFVRRLGIATAEDALRGDPQAAPTVAAPYPTGPSDDVVPGPA